MTRDEALLQAIQNDLAHYHAERMAKRQGEQMAALAAERAKTSPDPAAIEQLRRAMVQTALDKRDPSITEREVLEPLRRRLQQTDLGESSNAAQRPSQTS